MQCLKILVFSVILVVFCAKSSAQNIVVDDTYSAQQLVENVLVNSPCASVTNFSVSGDTFSGQQSYGYFSYSGTDFPFSNGIVLSTSRASRTAGPNTNLIDEGSTSWVGDADLEQALEITGTFNATALEFDFTPLSSQISFDYIFASEEYQGNAPCRYSDGFAFLLKVAGSADNYQNLALIPDTTTPVKVTTVHPEITGTNGCSAQNEAYFGSYNGGTHPINFNGQTIAMTAKATVIPGVTYHIKLVIADEENIRYDSAIFLGGGSFKIGANLGPDLLFATNNPICDGETYTIDATEPGTNTYQWFQNSLPLVGETNPLYDITSPGTYSVEIALNGTACIASDEIIVEYTSLPLVNNQTLVQCDADNDGVSFFNLTQLNSLITNGDTSLTTPVYYETLADAQAQNNAIQNPTSYENSTTNTVFAQVKSTFGCSNYATINLVISNNSIGTIAPIKLCDYDGNYNGLTTFDLNSLVTPSVLTGLPSGLVVEYYATTNDAVLQTNELPNNYTNTTANQQIIFARIINGPDCYGIVPVDLIVNNFNPPNFDAETLYLCDGNQIDISIATGFSSYNWSNGDADNATTITATGNYSVTVTDVNGCLKTKNYTVLPSNPATISSVIINDFSGLNNTIEIIALGLGNYEYSLNGVQYQNSPIFTNVFIGEYTVYVKDKYGCGIVSQDVFVLDYPKYFTPNGDGINDVWQIKNLEYIPSATITIYDRYGKLIYRFNSSQPGWNGKLNQLDLPSTDYWFTLTFDNRKELKGNFSLKR